MTHRPHDLPPSDQPTTVRTSRNFMKQYLPIGVVISAALSAGGMLWWVANQSRDIQDNKKAADAALAKATEALARADDARIKGAEILAKLSGIEAQLAELRALYLRRLP